MDTNVIFEKPLFSLHSRSYNGNGERVDVYYDDLCHADVGCCWAADATGNCGRDNFCESIKLVYKDTKGCAVLHRRWGTSDDPNPEEWESNPELFWIDFH